MVRVISFAHICFLLLSTLLVAAHQYTKCELFRELKVKHQLENEEAGKWTCIAGGVANYNTSFLLGELNYGLLGLFGIEAIFWCNEGKGQVCGVACEKFRDDDITDDLKCAREFVLKEYGGVYDTWYKYKQERCQIKWREIVKDCQENDEMMAKDEKIEVSSTSVRTVELEAIVTSLEETLNANKTSTSSEFSTSTSINTAENSTSETSTTSGSPVSSETSTSSGMPIISVTSSQFSTSVVSSTSEFVPAKTSSENTTTGVLSTVESSTASGLPSTSETVATSGLPISLNASTSVISSTSEFVTSRSSITAENSTSGVLSSFETSTTSGLPITSESSTTAEFSTAGLPIVSTTPETTTLSDVSTTTSRPFNSESKYSNITELQSVIHNPCKYMTYLQTVQNVPREETTTWTCLTLNMINCFIRQDSELCIIPCNAILRENCPKLTAIVKKVVKDLPKDASIQEFHLNDCTSIIGPFIENWCHNTKPAIMEEAKVVIQRNVPESTTTTSPIIESTTFTTIIVNNHTEATTTAQPITSTTGIETTTRGSINLNYASVLEDPCGTLLFIAQNYQMNKAEASIWLCILRDLTFCAYNCAVDCNTAKRYGLSRTNYCDELSLTIQGIFDAVKEPLTPLFSLIPFNNCKAEIFPFAVGLCPQLTLLKD